MEYSYRKKKPRVWELGASLRGAGDELGPVAGDANKSITTYVALIQCTFVAKPPQRDSIKLRDVISPYFGIRWVKIPILGVFPH